MNETIDLTDKSKWADGWQTHNRKATAEIVKQLSDGRFAVVLTDGDGDQWVGTRFADGKCWHDYEDGYDLIPRPVKHSGWVVLYRDTDGVIKPDRVFCYKRPTYFSSDCVACIPIEFTEGSGLNDNQ